MPDINDLPRFSPWPARLLGAVPSRQANRTADELTREFEGEKWGPLLDHARAAGNDFGLSEVEESQFDPKRRILAWMEGEWREGSAAEIRSLYFDWASAQLAPWLGPDCVVELGAGYGSVVLSLARRGVFGGARMMVGEYAESGVELIRLLAQREGISVTAGSCDFMAPRVVGMEVPPDSLIYTSFATCCVPQMEPSFVASLSALKPRVVVHIEPLYEHSPEDDLLGLMRRRYLEVNDYNRNLLELLRHREARGEIEILHEGPPGFGSNPLLAASVIAWRPRAS